MLSRLFGNAVEQITFAADELDVSFGGDFTFTLKSVEWPPAAAEWGSRTRNGFWPNRRLVGVWLLINSSLCVYMIQLPLNERCTLVFAFAHTPHHVVAG